MEESDQDNALTRRQALFNDPAFSDIRVDCGNSGIFNCHKAILSLSSGYFARELLDAPSSYIIEDNKLSLRDDRGGWLSYNMLQHIYGLEVENKEMIEEAIKFDDDLVTVAKYYEVISLYDLVKTRMTDRLRAAVGTESFAEQMTIIYGDCDNDFGVVAAESCLEDLEKHLADAEFKHLLQDVPRLAADLVRISLKQEPERAVEHLAKLIYRKSELAADIVIDCTRSLIASPKRVVKPRKRQRTSKE